MHPAGHACHMPYGMWRRKTPGASFYVVIIRYKPGVLADMAMSWTPSARGLQYAVTLKNVLWRNSPTSTSTLPTLVLCMCQKCLPDTLSVFDVTDGVSKRTSQKHCQAVGRAVLAIACGSHITDTTLKSLKLPPYQHPCK